MRIQFTVNDLTELPVLKELAEAAGYPDVPSYAKDAALQRRDYLQAWEIVTHAIKKKKTTDKPFALRDLIPVPPANLGVKLYENQEALGIKKIGKDSMGSNLFQKIRDDQGPD